MRRRLQIPVTPQQPKPEMAGVPRPVPVEVRRRSEGWLTLGWGTYWRRNRQNFA
jgi:hypothetical protein